MSTIWRPAESVVSREIDGHMLLVVLGRNESTFLNPVGSALWSRLDGESSAAALAGNLANAYGMARSDASAAVAPFLERLSDLGLIEQVEPGHWVAERSQEPLAFPSDYDVPSVAAMESLQVMGGCNSSDAFCSGTPGSV